MMTIRTKYSFSPDSFSHTWKDINIVNLERETPMPISQKRKFISRLGLGYYIFFR